MTTNINFIAFRAQGNDTQSCQKELYKLIILCLKVIVRADHQVYDNPRNGNI